MAASSHKNTVTPTHTHSYTETSTHNYPNMYVYTPISRPYSTGKTLKLMSAGPETTSNNEFIKDAQQRDQGFGVLMIINTL